MVMQPEQVEQLRALLHNMDACARNIEHIAERERQAAHLLDADALADLSDLRALSHQSLADMEKQTRKLLARCGAPADMPLGTFIDMHTPKGHSDLQALRRNLYQRLTLVQKSDNETRLHLKASNDVAVGILQHIGAIEPKQTYGPRGAT